MRLKKIIADLLCSPFIGKLIVAVFNKKVPSLRDRGYRFSVPPQHSSSVIHASIFWGIYESAEIRLIKRFLKADLPVVELGGSLGIVSSFIIGKLNKKASLKVVEANPNLISTIQSNLERHNKNKIEFEIINNALGYDDEYLHMHISSDNTASHIIRSESEKKSLISVQCIRLVDLVGSSRYTLVCDIEGSEIEILMNDQKILSQCNQLFIELHNTSYKGVVYKSDELAELIKTLGFSCKAKDGNVYFFERQ